MHRTPCRRLAAACGITLLLALGACGRPADEQGLATGKGAGAAPSATSAKDAAPPAGRATAKADAALDRAAQDTRAMGAAAADKTRAMGSSAAGKVDDASVTAKVNAALAADKELAATRVDVDTQNGVVTLSGPVSTVSVKEHAAEVARSVKGVTSVNNQLTLKSG